MRAFSFFIMITGLAVAGTSNAQVNSLKSQYFENAFLINPSQAGSSEKAIASAGYASQWNMIPGAPVLLSLTAHTPVTEKMGVGAYILNDKAGLLNRTTIMGSYSYKVKLEEKRHLALGLSAGILTDKLNTSGALPGNNSSDIAIGGYNNETETLFRGGFGAGYKSERLQVLASWFNINRKKHGNLKTADRPGITATASYEFGNESRFLYKPIAGYRQIRGLTDYWDAGINVSYQQSVDLTFLYHTNKSITGGVAFDYRRLARVLLLYNTEPAEIRGTTGGSYELSVYVPFNFRQARKNEKAKPANE